MESINIVEEWKVINNFPSYRISSIGRVCKIKYNRRYYLKLTDNGKGYCKVCLYHERKHKYLYVHRLVAEAFIPNSDNKPFINHKNGIKNNNYYTNLEWATFSENMKHGFDTNLYPSGEQHYNSKISNETISNIKKMYATNKYTQNQLAIYYNISGAMVCLIVNNKIRKRG